ncbi:hypothetical protein OGAPHI_006683 [Ogataea philodendri]|uniref:pH-response regulator protein palH/RIM21 n=1 Tax=Ogataea philodendri TaxID=1378263 RepID=A0A9P8T0C1_9ASCO|nr:uncharacterized protein OGAPHI_006683 [Ogataea philodendri]KAH3661276.1 hypothetical protein OGAPHI_006683 [Ogataea philodendri]
MAHTLSTTHLLYSTNLKLNEWNIPRLPQFESLWNEYLTGFAPKESADFKDSIYPVIYVISTAAVLSVFLTAILLKKHHLRLLKPTWLIKLSTLVATGQLVSFYIYALILLAQQARMGESSAERFLDTITDSLGYNVVYFISYLLLLLTQVEVIRKMFSRKREQQLILIIGIVLAIVSQVIWGASTLASNIDNSDVEVPALVILPVVMYLLRISLSVLYDCLLQVYAFSKKDLVFQPSVLPLTIIMQLTANATVAFFIADLANTWVSQLSEVFNITCSLTVNVISWEWLNRMYRLEKQRQKQGVLGRQLFDETGSRPRKHFNLKPDFVKLKKSMKAKEILNPLASNDVYVYTPKQLVVPSVSSHQRRDPVVHVVRQLSHHEEEDSYSDSGSEEEALLQRVQAENQEVVDSVRPESDDDECDMFTRSGLSEIVEMNGWPTYEYRIFLNPNWRKVGTIFELASETTHLRSKLNLAIFSQTKRRRFSSSDCGLRSFCMDSRSQMNSCKYPDGLSARLNSASVETKLSSVTASVKSGQHMQDCEESASGSWSLETVVNEE